MTSVFAVIAFAAILIAGAYYADRVYEAPEEPPEILYTIKGPVVLHKKADPGDLITAPNLGTIYYLNQDSKRIVFPDEQTFLSWYPNFELVKTIPQELLESFPLAGRNATIRPGTHLITIPSSSQVWMIGWPTNLHWMEGGEEQAISIYGENWSELVVDLPEYYFGNYTESYSISSPEIYPTGQLVHVLSNDQYYLIADNGQRLVTEDGFKANHLQKKFAIEREEPIELTGFGPNLDSMELRWSSPDPKEQATDPGPEDLDVGNAEAEIG